MSLAAQLADLKSICRQLVEPWQLETLAIPFEIFVAGIGSGGPAAFVVGNTDAGGVTPWQVVEIPYLIMTPQIDPAAYQQIVAAADPLSLMPSAMRLQAAAHPAQIGGFIQQTTISAAGIWSSIVESR